MFKLKETIQSIIDKFKSKYITLEITYPDVNTEWDDYDIREINKTTNELRNTLVDIPYFFSYEDEEE